MAPRMFHGCALLFSVRVLFCRIQNRTYMLAFCLLMANMYSKQHFNGNAFCGSGRQPLIGHLFVSVDVFVSRRQVVSGVPVMFLV